MKKNIILVYCILISFFASSLVFAQEATTTLFDQTDMSSCIQITSKVLKYKSKDSETNGEVTLVQDFLNDKGYLAQAPSGFYGLKTVEAVKKYQIQKGVARTGTVGSLTKKLLSSDTCESATVESTISPIAKKNTENLQTTIVVTTPTVSKSTVNWNNSDYGLTSFPKAIDTWREKLAVKDLPSDSYLKILFDKQKPLLSQLESEKVSKVSLDGYSMSSGYFGEKGIKTENLAAFWGKSFIISADNLYSVTARSYSDVRVIIDGRQIIQGQGSNGATLNQDTEVYLKAGKHDVEIEYTNNTGKPEINFSFKTVAEIKKIQNNTIETIIPNGSEVDLVSINSAKNGKVDVTIKSGYTPKYLLLSSNSDVDWQFKGDTSGIKGIAVDSIKQGSSVSGVRDGLVTNVQSGVSNNHDSIPLVTTLLTSCDKTRPLTVGTTTYPSYVHCDNQYSTAKDILPFLKRHEFTIKSFTGSPANNNISIGFLNIPGNTFSGNDDLKKFMDDSAKKAKEDAEKINFTY